MRLYFVLWSVEQKVLGCVIRSQHAQPHNVHIAMLGNDEKKMTTGMFTIVGNDDLHYRDLFDLRFYR